MFKVSKKKLMIAFIAVAAVGGILATILLGFHNVETTIRSSQVSSMKESYLKDVTENSQDEQENNADQDLSLLSDTKDSKDDSQDNNDNTNQQETISTKIEKPNHSNANQQKAVSSKSEESSRDTNQQETISAKLEESNQNDSNQQMAISSQPKDANNNANVENQESTNATLEVKRPTFHYDRITSIYNNDNITLLRREYYANNKLTYYSVVTQFDATTQSYIEKIYQCNRETNIDPLIRTDVYVNGTLTNSY